jgi:hypothetical protein
MFAYLNNTTWTNNSCIHNIGDRVEGNKFTRWSLVKRATRRGLKKTSDAFSWHLRPSLFFHLSDSTANISNLVKGSVFYSIIKIQTSCTKMEIHQYHAWSRVSARGGWGISPPPSNDSMGISPLNLIFRDHTANTFYSHNFQFIHFKSKWLPPSSCQTSYILGRQGSSFWIVLLPTQNWQGSNLMLSGRTGAAPGKLKRSKLLCSKVSAWLFRDVFIHTLAKEPLYEKRCVSERMDPYTPH